MTKERIAQEKENKNKNKFRIQFSSHKTFTGYFGLVETFYFSANTKKKKEEK